MYYADIFRCAVNKTLQLQQREVTNGRAHSSRQTKKLKQKPNKCYTVELNYYFLSLSVCLSVPGEERNAYPKSSLSIHCLKQGTPRQRSSGLD
jgi:hypothetical protein